MSRNSQSDLPKVPTLDLSAVVVYPNRRDVAFASLGYLKVYEMLTRRLGLADLSYLPAGPHDGVLSRRKGLLLGAESGIEVRGFDLVAFSVSYENDYVRVPELLLKAGIPVKGTERAEALPLVIAGGFTMSMNPLPIADFVDVVVVGEAEPVLDSLLELVDEAKRKGWAKAHLSQALIRLEGVYVPALGEEPVRRVWSKEEDLAPEPTGVRPSHFGSMSLVEVGRGCGRGCLFCAAGNLYRPVRMRDIGSIRRRVGSATEVGLVGTAVGDHPDLIPLLRSLVDQGCRIGTSSLRADQVTPELAGLLARGGLRSIAIAPEAGTQALRDTINKGITEEQVIRAIRALSAAGITNIKLYFMIGLPGETDRDIEAIVALVEKLATLRGRSKLSIAVAPFVPKPHTALQWAPLADRQTLKRRITILRSIAGMRGCSLKVGSMDQAWTEAVLTRGDRWLSEPLLEAALSGKSLRYVLKRSRIPNPCRELDIIKPLPWDFIDSGTSKKGLLSKYRHGRSG